jgi:hypothetical protein
VRTCPSKPTSDFSRASVCPASNASASVASARQTSHISAARTASTADVWPSVTAMDEDVSVSAAGVYQSVGQDGQAVEGTLLIDVAGQLDHRAVVPGKP